MKNPKIAPAPAKKYGSGSETLIKIETFATKISKIVEPGNHLIDDVILWHLVLLLVVIVLLAEDGLQQLLPLAARRPLVEHACLDHLLVHVQLVPEHIKVISRRYLHITFITFG